MKNKARKGKHEPHEESEEDDAEPRSQADHPDERLRGFLRDRFPEGLHRSQSPKEEYPEDVKDRKPRKGEKRPAP